MTGQIDMKARKTWATKQINASAEKIFDILADASQHPSIDGSGMVQRVGKTPERLELGSRFGMDMRLKFLPYKISNKVVEFEENRVIAWQHLGKHRWRYELEPNDEGTLVTETFDWSTSIAPKAIEMAGYPKQHLPNIERTLERLAEVVEA